MDSQLKVSRAVTSLAFAEPFFGSCLMQLKLQKAEWLPTMGTDGYNLWWNDDFVQTLTEEHTRAVLAHEVCHVIFKHCTKLKGRDPRLANVAMDWVINRILKEAGFVLPEGALFDPDGTTNGWAWEEVYNYLRNVQQDMSMPGNGGSEEEDQEGSGSGSQSGEESSDEGEEGSSEGKESSDIMRGTPAAGKPGPSKSTKEKIMDQIGKAEDHVQESEAKDDASRAEEEARIDDMVIKASNAQEMAGKGSIPGDIRTRIQEIREPKLDWVEILHDLVKSKYPIDFTFRRPNRKHFQEGLYLPSMDGTQVGPLVIAFDSSGSVSIDETKAFVGEVNTIINDLKPEKVWLMSSDHRVANVEEYESDVWFDYKTFESVGGGGTSFIPVFDYVRENNLQPDQLVYFSDMEVWEGDFPKEHPDYPVIFVSTRKNAKAPFGEIVYLDID